jgi:hypothetical protein
VKRMSVAAHSPRCPSLKPKPMLDIEIPEACSSLHHCVEEACGLHLVAAARPGHPWKASDDTESTVNAVQTSRKLDLLSFQWPILP